MVDKVDNSLCFSMDVTTPPFQETYKALLKELPIEPENENLLNVVEEVELPVVDMERLLLGDGVEREKCIKQVIGAASEWGFLQVVNHGVSRQLLESILKEQVSVFYQPFQKKIEDGFLNLPPNSYRWGNNRANCLRQLSWSEALHIPLNDISRMDDMGLRKTIEEFAEAVRTIAYCVVEILAENLVWKSNFFKDYCIPSSSYVRMNRYPPCPFSSKILGLVPHTDSDFLTILVNHSQVGGLQLEKNERWINVRPNPKAMSINIGDLLQAFSNDVYKSIKHRVLAPQEVERFSTAYFCCPPPDSVIQICGKPPRYRSFNFNEYKQQINKDVEATGAKVGLPKFLLDL